MRLPLIKDLVRFSEEKDEDYLTETVETLEALTESDSLKDAELDVIGELISNIYGALEVKKLMHEGQTQSQALNSFMSRVKGAIDK
ncbi:MAG: hypothetical protein JWQ27_2471 [Ferruginibacter sp.]|nr:hypothetical protein [Ferruginibacter sp.]